MTCPIGSMVNFYANPSECHVYHSCSNGVVTTMECPKGLHFSGKHQKCVEPSLSSCNKNQSNEESAEQEDSEEIVTLKTK